MGRGGGGARTTPRQREERWERKRQASTRRLEFEWQEQLAEVRAWVIDMPAGTLVPSSADHVAWKAAPVGKVAARNRAPIIKTLEGEGLIRRGRYKRAYRTVDSSAQAAA